MHNIIFIIWYKIPKLFLIPLLPFSLIFLVIILVRKYIFINLLLRYTSKSKLIIIGNLNVGGSGKTPFTIWLANYLHTKEKKIAIISSGYKSNVNSPVEINHLSKADDVGDEALLLQAKTNSVVVSSNNRVKSTKYLEDRDFEYIIHDDGLQHYYLNRNYEFVITKYKSPTNNYLLPCGPLREPKFFHPDATFILSNYHDNEYPGFYTKLSQIRSSIDNKVFALNDGKFTKSHLLTAIADDTDLKQELKLYHKNIKSLSFADHHKFILEDIPATTEPIIVTEKDFTKLKVFNIENIYILEQSVFPNDKLIKIIEKL